MIAADDARAVIATRLLASPVARAIGLELDTVATGAVRVRLPFAEANTTEGQVIHGGVIATLADVTAVATAVSSARDVPTGGATANLTVHYLAPASGCELFATGRTLHSGMRQHVVSIEIADESGRPIAAALVTVLLG